MYRTMIAEGEAVGFSEERGLAQSQGRSMVERRLRVDRKRIHLLTRCCRNWVRWWARRS